MMHPIGIPYDVPALARVNLNHLLYFWAVARAGSVTAAAEAIGVSQPAVSEQVKKLEQRLGAALLKRGPRGVVLTPAGERAMRHADEVAGVCAELLRALPLKEEARERPLVAGTADSVPKHIVQSVLGPILRERPALSIVCREWRVDHLLSELSVHRLDVVLTDAPIRAGQPGHLTSYSAGRSSISMGASPELARRLKPGFPRSLHGAPVLFPAQGTSLREILDRWFALRRIRPRIVVEAEDRALLHEFARAGLGAAPVALPLGDQDHPSDLTIIGALRGAQEEYFAVVIDQPRQHTAVELLRNQLQQSGMARRPRRGAPSRARSPRANRSRR
jgi:LysR family transcriptional activator of nhaA